MPRFTTIFLLLLVLARALAGTPTLTAIWEMEGSSLDPNGQPRPNEGSSLDPSGQPRTDNGGSLDPSGRT